MRTSEITRKTKETDITLKLCLDGGEVKIDTGIGFFDHMLNSFATHGGFGLEISAKGDLEVDGHHTVEDVGIVLGKAFNEALGDKGSIERFGSFYVPMDEALAFASVDVSGRPFLVFDAEFPQAVCGDYDCSLTVEFMRALAYNAQITLHIKSVYGDNSHHITEAVFKAAAHALKAAVAQNNSGKPLSTKGVL
ncbi:MAG: imidazoleglycerol-phosphate dehydratase HisB [Ruminococcus sp.]|jgi:imidazoleglycerol-phosphate dehydratase|uniref:imidazoleglycerol-phosphate dehydratase HisB n=1 Tax=Ruminococcus sp. JL13D9 TaxID=3233381 RepID=UPI002709C60D|nr:imidazoleglycerol-phosphate dehydratase HisB [Ruminococcus sp.]MDO4881786.1 imidazoleglycerol-phosphate dehydratase HisB [Oscillospiraceae bacterium]MEE1017519.1 imidazoleglycerol-phosphate dehydratase HisB [Ruminococcus sp.]